MSNFNLSVQYVLENEGGFVNDVNDHGGATNFGITQQTLSTFRGRPCSVEDVRGLLKDDAIEIYYRYFYSPLGLILVESNSITTAIMDISVNDGIFQGAKLAQKALNDLFLDVEVDGHLGPSSIDALNRADSYRFLTAFEARATQFYYSLVVKYPEDRKFLNGWLKRAERLLTLRSE